MNGASSSKAVHHDMLESLLMLQMSPNTELPEFQSFPSLEANKSDYRLRMDPHGGSADHGWLQLERYSKYFSVTTEEVIQRILNAATLRGTFLEDFTSRPDLFGPLWIAISLGSLIFMVHTKGRLLPGAVPGKTTDLSTLFSILSSLLAYLGIICGGGWLGLRWLGAESLRFVELCGLVGYSLVLLFPAVLIGALSVNILSWMAMLACIAASAPFIYQNLAPVLRTSALGPEKGVMYTAAVCLIHSLFLVSLKIAYI